MMTMTDLDRDAAADLCQDEHTEPMIGCDECKIRTDERLCLDCGRYVRDGEVLVESAGGFPPCAHESVRDGFGNDVIGV